MPETTDERPAEPIDFTTEFPILGRSVFFNHAAVAPLPGSAARALTTFADEAATEGALAWPRWNRKLQAARGHAAGLLAASTDEIAFVHNTTHGLLCLAHGLPWRPGDNIIGIEHEFPANVYPWRQLAARGVARRVVRERPDHTFAIDDFIPMIDRRTRMLAVSLVHYASGFRLPVEQLAAVCRERGILFCIDGIQGIGAMPTRVDELGCDFMVADGHKWMLGPEGLGILYVRRERLELFGEAMTGWVGRVRPWDYDDLDQPLQAGARRFEEGSHNMACAVALEASLDVIRRTGIEQAWHRIEALTARLAEGLQRLGCTLISPRGDGRRSGILAVTREGMDPDRAVESLARRDCHVTARRGWLRLSPHFYNGPDQVDRLLAEFAGCLDA